MKEILLICHIDKETGNPLRHSIFRIENLRAAQEPAQTSTCQNDPKFMLGDNALNGQLISILHHFAIIGMNSLKDSVERRSIDRRIRPKHPVSARGPKRRSFRQIARPQSELSHFFCD